MIHKIYFWIAIFSHFLLLRQTERQSDINEKRWNSHGKMKFVAVCFTKHSGPKMLKKCRPSENILNQATFLKKCSLIFQFFVPNSGFFFKFQNFQKKKRKIRKICSQIVENFPIPLKFLEREPFKKSYKTPYFFPNFKSLSNELFTSH